jgi:hypothetical protein
MEFNYNYATPSTLAAVGGTTVLSFSADRNRKEVVSFKGRLKNVLNYRDAMLCLRDVVVSDLRTPVKDRTEYLKWAEKEVARLATESLLNQKAIQEAVSAEITKLESEKSVLDAEWKETWKDYYPLERPFWKFMQNLDHDLWMVLDPVISVHPDAVSFEAFSKDESTYACLSVDMGQFDRLQEPQYGTTNIDFSKKLGDEFLRVRTYNPFELSIDPAGFTVESGKRPQYLEKKIDLPESWVRGFLQVSSAAAIPGIEFALNPIDMYLICSYLRRKNAHWSPRALRFELRPNMRVRAIFEPWEEAIELSAVFSGPEPVVVRTWGRRRLFLLERLLPLANRFRVRLLGQGLPAFYIAELPGMTLTLGLSGWVAKDWSGGAVFNAMSGFAGEGFNPTLVDALRTARSLTMSEMQEKVPQSPQTEIMATVGNLFRHGLAFYDAAKGRIRFRMLSQQPFPSHLTEPSPVEKEALTLATTLKEVKIKVNPDKSILAQAQSVKDRRKTLSLELKLNGDGIVTDANCQCRQFQREKLAGGPCEHLLGLQFRVLGIVKPPAQGS